MIKLLLNTPIEQSTFLSLQTADINTKGTRVNRKINYITGAYTTPKT
jgi:hypothetical protein